MPGSSSPEPRAAGRQPRAARAAFHVDPAGGSEMAAPEQARPSTVGRQPVIDYVTNGLRGLRADDARPDPGTPANWTDQSESDFGVVLIELFAYVADILSYSTLVHFGLAADLTVEAPGLQYELWTVDRPGEPDVTSRDPQL
jgi:hypothetical protein